MTRLAPGATVAPFIIAIQDVLFWGAITGVGLRRAV